MEFKSAKEALNWMVNHPLEKLYDEYGNFYLWGPYSNVIEHHYEIDIENGLWDFDRLNVEEFLDYDNYEFGVLESID